MNPIRLVAFVAAAGLLAAVPEALSSRKSGDVELTVTFDPTPDAAWQPSSGVLLYVDARRNPEIGEEDIFAGTAFPGVYARTPGQRFSFTLPDVEVGEVVLVQGYMCAEGTTDCYPSDSDNPPSCAAEVRILGSLRPSCEPVFTWTGGSGDGGVLCEASCDRTHGRR